MAKKEKIHFIGIGGIGTSALAQYYLKKGYKVFGSDLVASETTKTLENAGTKIFTGRHKAKNITQDISQVIYSPAIQKNNPELKKARKLRIKCQSYPEALGELTKKYFTIAVSGTHGKSTTTALIALILRKAGFKPTVILGTKLKEFGNSNFRMGKPTFRLVPRLVPPGSAILVIEADEWQASFLKYFPKIIVLTNIEREHLDYYKNLNHILQTFKKYISHLPKDGWLVANKDDKNVNRIISKVVENLRWYARGSRGSKKLRKILKIPGEHNVSNALAALTVARIFKIPYRISFKALSEYRGSWRRFEITEIRYPIRYTIVNDYGHHPTEIGVTLKAAREKYPKKKIWCVFQPHQYQRTFYLFKDFVRVFAQAPIDSLIITDIYDVAGREKKEIKRKVNSKKLIETINKAARDRKERIYLPKEEIKNYLKKKINKEDVIIIMGAGDIYKLAEEFST